MAVYNIQSQGVQQTFFFSFLYFLFLITCCNGNSGIQKYLKGFAISPACIAVCHLQGGSGTKQSTFPSLFTHPGEEKGKLCDIQISKYSSHAYKGNTGMAYSNLRKKNKGSLPDKPSPFPWTRSSWCPASYALRAGQSEGQKPHPYGAAQVTVVYKLKMRCWWATLTGILPCPVPRQAAPLHVVSVMKTTRDGVSQKCDGQTLRARQFLLERRLLSQSQQ